MADDAPSAAAAIASSGAAILSAQTQPAAPVVIERGHVDLVEVTRDGSRLVVSVKDDTTGGAAVYRSPAEVQLRVPDSSRTAVPEGPFAFLGAPGSQVFLLPQVQDPSVVWPGWSTERLSAGSLVGDAVRIRLVGVDGPGELAVFTTDQFGSPSLLFDSDGVAPNEIRVPIRTHAHANWAFSAPGAHRVTLEVLGDLAGSGATATRVTYVFLVGDTAAPVPVADVPPPATVTVDATPSASPGAVAGGATSEGPASPKAAVSSDAGEGSATGATTAVDGRLATTGGYSDRGALLGLLLVAFGTVVIVSGRSVRRRSHTR